MSLSFRVLVLALAICGVAAPVLAQDHDGARVSGFYAGALGGGETNVGAGGSVGYRFTPRLGFDFEVLALPDFEIGHSEGDGRGVAFLTNFVAEFPSPASWLMPYVQGGGGVASIAANYAAFDMDDPLLPARSRLDVRRGPRGPGGPATFLARDRSETSLALSVGGGVDFAIWRALSVGPSISYMRLFGSYQDLDLTRIGARASYRF